MQSEIISLLVFCMALIPISLYNLLPSPERRNSSLFCFSPQLLSCLEGWLKSEKCIRAHINSVRFAYFSYKTLHLFSSFAINSMTKHKMLLLYTVCANTSVAVDFSCTGRLARASFLLLVGKSRCTWHCGKHAIIRPLPPPAALLCSQRVQVGQWCRVSSLVRNLYFP